MKLLKISINGRIFRIKDCRGIASLRGLIFDNMKNIDGALISGNSIWMPFVKYKLKLIFLDNEFKVINTEDAVPISFNPKTWKTYSCLNAKYCLEINKNVRVSRGSKIL